MLDSVKYWLRDQAIQNFGDALTRVYMDRLFLPIGSQATSVHLVGSVIDDMFVEDARKEHAGAEPVFWGCGIRTEGGLSEQNRSLAKILSVRGPISAKALNVEGKVPIGDSALLLPAIYTPSSGSEGSNKAICIPHFHDDRSDEELLALSKCDDVLRSRLGPDLPDIYNTIDRIVSARFVLSASLHGAIVAVAYGRPFCFWDNGSIDLPLKWQDFAASIGVPCLFAKDISEAVAAYEANLQKKIKLPPILPLALSGPFIVHADAMANILRRALGDCEPELEQLVAGASPVAKANRMLMDVILAAQKLDQQNEQLNVHLDVLRLKEISALENKEQEQKQREEETRVLFEASQRYAQIKALLNSRERDRKNILEKLIFKLRAVRYEKLIRRSGLFAEDWYRTSYPDVPRGKNVVRHYITRGRYEGKNPNPYFDTNWYYGAYPDTLVSGSNPLVHYLKEGASQGRDPSPLFSTTGYLKAHPELKRTKVNPLAHFLSDALLIPDEDEETTAIPASQTATRYSAVSSTAHPRVVIIDSVYPTPDKDSGSIDAVNFVSTFIRLGYDVTFISDSQFYDSEATFEPLEELDVRVVNNRHYSSLEGFIRQEGKEVSIFFLSRVHCGGRWLETAFRNSNAKIIFNTVDLHFLREERQAKLESDRKQLNLAAGTRERELCVTRLADATIVVSEAEGELLRELVPDAKIVVIPLARESPGAKNTFEERSDIGFIGGFAHAPNVDAIRYFVKDIWPIIKVKHPAMKFYIYGSEMPDSFFAFKSLDVVPVGYVKEVGPILDQRRVMIAPLRYGAGAKGKVVTSLAHGVPCVASSVAGEGMGLTAGKNILIANTPEQFADEVVSVYSNKELWSAISASGIELIREHFAIQNTVDKLKALLNELHIEAN